jgi:hypothetical protein
VKPDSGQHLSKIKFALDDTKTAYTEIKALKTILKIDLDNYFLKKLLMRPIDVAVYGEDYDNSFFYNVMHLPELMEKFKSRIDYEKWNFETRYDIPLKKEIDNAY